MKGLPWFLADRAEDVLRMTEPRKAEGGRERAKRTVRRVRGAGSEGKSRKESGVRRKGEEQ